MISTECISSLQVKCIKIPVEGLSYDITARLVSSLTSVSLPRKSVVRLTDRPDMTLDVYRGRKTTKQQQQLTSVSFNAEICFHFHKIQDFGCFLLYCL